MVILASFERIKLPLDIIKVTGCSMPAIKCLKLRTADDAFVVISKWSMGTGRESDRYSSRATVMDN